MSGRGSDGHVPVMLSRIVELLAPALAGPGAVYVDCTLGLGGHAEAILQNCPSARLVGIDRDPDAIEVARARLAGFSERVTFVHAVYDELPDVLAELGLEQVSAILLDLGLSSLQIDRRERGFAYAVDAPLDMRMDSTSGRTAAEVLNTYSQSDLTRILRRYGEERHADRIARGIVTEREHAPFESSERLVATILDALPAAARYAQGGGHPAKRTFQALRIEVNDELSALEVVLPEALRALSVGGRVAVLAYHSLEDRLVKDALRSATTDRAPRGLPVVPEGLRAEFRLLTHGAERPEADEVAENPRAASARLRAAERVGMAA